MQEYNNTDKQLHWLSQVIAKVNKAFVPEQPDDSHTNLAFDSLAGRITGRWFSSPEGDIMLGLNLEEMQFEWLNKTLKMLDSVRIFDKPMQQIEKEVAEYPAKLGMKTNDIFKPLHYQIPDYGIQSISEKDTSKDALANWKYYRQLASEACQTLLGYLQAQGEVRIWPHHFDTGIYAQVTSDLGIGFGLAMNDDMAGNAYYYMAGYKSPGTIAYHKLPDLTAGRWETGAGWNGAILPINEAMYDSKAIAEAVIENFIRQTSNWILKQIN